MQTMQAIAPTIDTAPPGIASVPSEIATCRVCTIRLLETCYQRAWWFRPFREVFATGIRLAALSHPVPPEVYEARSPLCHGCLRFRKNAARQGSPVFRWLDSWLNPLFNRVRDSLLTPEEIEHARELARRASDPAFNGW
jgi:hypothetical protein